VLGKALPKKFIFVVLCFEKFETIQLSKFESSTKETRSFIIAKFLQNLTKIFSKLNEIF